MTFPEAVKSAFKNYIRFEGRATRSEYWWFALFQFIVLLIPALLSEMGGIIGGLGGLLRFGILAALFLPSLGLMFRRLHDTERSAWWLLILFVPVIGQSIGLIVIIVFMCLKGTPGPNKFGPQPGAASVVDTFS